LPLVTGFPSFSICAKKSGFEHAPIKLLHEDFLNSTAVKDAISSAGLVYMNNPRFGPELNLQVLSEPSLSPFNHETCSPHAVQSGFFKNFCRSTLSPDSKGLQIGTLRLSSPTTFVTIPKAADAADAADADVVRLSFNFVIFF
jgi:hypothetical protein